MHNNISKIKYFGALHNFSDETGVLVVGIGDIEVVKMQRTIIVYRCADCHVTLIRVRLLRLEIRNLMLKQQTWSQSRLWAVEHMASSRECGIDLVTL